MLQKFNERKGFFFAPGWQSRDDCSVHQSPDSKKLKLEKFLLPIVMLAVGRNKRLLCGGNMGEKGREWKKRRKY